MERDDHMEAIATRFSSRRLRIVTLALRVTTIILLVTSLLILVTNVLRVPYGDDQVSTIRFYDVNGFKYMLYIIIIVIGYSMLQIVFVLLQMKDVMSSDPHLICVYYGEWASSILLILGGIAGYCSTKEYKKWVSDMAISYSSEYDHYFQKSYASATLLLLAFVSTFITSVIFSCLLSNTLTSDVTLRKNSSKVNAIVDDP
ncbi:CASP-like protein 4D1 [Humulus lupulus]|uniref:CASP-like protein 4D1 n=1 Tax=Humulus lupulus TaxID=3486 RepID=UPI002B40FB22|nr:CASP-like protein 4D1 [Humulus lupulus]